MMPELMFGVKGEEPNICLHPLLMAATVPLTP
jgi:hypothetical protein